MRLIQQKITIKRNKILRIYVKNNEYTVLFKTKRKYILRKNKKGDIICVRW